MLAVPSWPSAPETLSDESCTPFDEPSQSFDANWHLVVTPEGVVAVPGRDPAHVVLEELAVDAPTVVQELSDWGLLQSGVVPSLEANGTKEQADDESDWMLTLPKCFAGATRSVYPFTSV